VVDVVRRITDIMLAAQHGATSCPRNAVVSSAGTIAARRHGPSMPPASSGDFTIDKPMEMQNHRAICTVRAPNSSGSAAEAHVLGALTFL